MKQHFNVLHSQMNKGEIQHVVFPATLYGMIQQRFFCLSCTSVFIRNIDNFHITIKAYNYSTSYFEDHSQVSTFTFTSTVRQGGNWCNVPDSIFRKYFNIMKCKIKPSTNLKMKGASSVELLLLPESLLPNFKCINNSENISVGSEGGGRTGAEFPLEN